jgi:hypothetical protein
MANLRSTCGAVILSAAASMAEFFAIFLSKIACQALKSHNPRPFM